MLYYKATASCGAGFFVGVSVCKRTAPVALILVSRAAGCCRPRCRPSPLLRHPLHAHWTHPYSIPCSVVRPPHVSYPHSFLVARPPSLGRLITSAHAFPTPRVSLFTFIPLLHTPCLPRNSIARRIRRRLFNRGCMVLPAAVATVVVFLAAAWGASWGVLGRPLSPPSSSRSPRHPPRIKRTAMSYCITMSVSYTKAS